MKRLLTILLTILPLCVLAQENDVKPFTADRLTFILDEFNETAYGKTDSFVELSACWMLSKRVQIDISSDIYLNYPGHYNCLRIGLAWQITKK